MNIWKAVKGVILMSDQPFGPDPVEGARIRDFCNDVLRAELALYKSKTPHTADGKPIFIGDTLWVGDENEIHSGEVSVIEGITDEDDEAACLIRIEFIKESHDARFCGCENKFYYSTREALEAVMEGGAE